MPAKLLTKMKKSSVLFFALLFISASITAKDLPLLGKWLLTTVNADGQTQELYSELIFNEDGTAEIEGRAFGTWSFDNKTKTYRIESEMIKEFSGAWKLSKVSKSEMALSKEGTKLFLTRLDQEKIALENQASGLMGVWQYENEEGTSYLNFEAPNNLLVISYSDYGSSRSNGTWIYDKNKNTIIMLVNERALRGSSKIIKLTSEIFEIEKSGILITAKKLEKITKPIGKLEFTSDDISDSHNNEEPNITLESKPFSWLNYQAKTSYLKELNTLTYLHSTLLEGLNVFSTEEIVANVTYDEDYNEIFIDRIFGELSTERYEEDNTFYPIEGRDYYEYRVVGEEQITVAAGTFTCKVIEQADYDFKMKFYMITNRPGVYAKVIFQGEDSYEIYELSNLDDNFTEQTNTDIIGDWLLVKSKTTDKTKIESTSYEFINDGRLSITSTSYRDFQTWGINSEGNSMSINFDGGVKEYSVATLTSSKMELKNEEQTLFFTKWDLVSVTENNKTSTLPSYWMLTEGGYDYYSILYFDMDDSFYDIAGVRRMPLEENYKMKRGKWMHNQTESTLIFKIDDYQSSVTGSYSISKLTESQFILDGKYVYTKIDTELFTINNKESGLEGLWKIAKGDGSFIYYEFKAPYQFRRGFEEANLHMGGLWFYNPDTEFLFIGYQMHQLEGYTKIKELTSGKIIFENGLVAIRVE